MGVGAGLYMFDVVVKSSRSLSHPLMSSCIQCEHCVVCRCLTACACVVHLFQQLINDKLYSPYNGSIIEIVKK